MAQDKESNTIKYLAAVGIPKINLVRGYLIFRFFSYKELTAIKITLATVNGSSRNVPYYSSFKKIKDTLRC